MTWKTVDTFCCGSSNNWDFFAHNCFCQSAQSLRSSCKHVWRIWIPSRSIRATWCIDGTIICSQWNQGRSSFGEWRPSTPESSITTIWRTNQNAFTRTKWVNSVWMQDSYMLLKLDSISWQKTQENNSLRGLVVNTLFQEVTNHHNQKDGFKETRELDLCWKLRPVIQKENMELKLESGLWVKTTLNPGSEFLMDQINAWLIRTTTTQKFPADLPEEQASQLIVKDFACRSKERTCWLFTEHHSDEWKKVDCYWTRRFLSAYEISKKVIHLLRLSEQVQRENDGAVQFWRIKNHLQNQFPQIQYWSDHSWKVCLAAGGGPKRRYQYCTDISATIIYLRALGRNLIDPSLQDNVIIQRWFFQHIYHIGCAFNLHSIINNGLTPGGQNSSKRQTVFFLPIDPRDKGHQDPWKIDLTRSLGSYRGRNAVGISRKRKLSIHFTAEMEDSVVPWERKIGIH